VPEEVSPERRYVEEFGTALTGMGLPPAYAKVLGWLLICDPAGQSVSDIARATGVSMGSVSTGARLLENAGLLRRVAVPGRRGRFYEMAPDSFMRVVEQGTSFTRMRQLLDRGLAMLGDQPGGRAERLRQTRDFYAFVERELPELVRRFKTEYQIEKRDGDG
jgi:DNA-binding transcriptional ArsR family regulator